jgi:bifunctional ADP-heptose synthase (sugar kinase/adenylyltransferase)
VKSIWVAGDYFRDEFNVGHYVGHGPRFVVEETTTRPGGAANALANARSICNGTAIQCEPTGYSDPRTLKRWIEDDQIAFEYWDIEDELQEPNPWCMIKSKKLKDLLGPEYKALIVSDYNKGFSTQEVPALPIFDLLVVDSRYRTAPMSDLKLLAKTCIWRCTGQEYDAEYAKHFDFVVHTNHNSRIEVIEVGQPGPPVIVEVHPMIVVDPCGAGDTFTAALTAYLVNAGAVTWGHILEGSAFAVTAAQNVCTKRFTATTDVKLKR